MRRISILLILILVMTGCVPKEDEGTAPIVNETVPVENEAEGSSSTDASNSDSTTTDASTTTEPPEPPEPTQAELTLASMTLEEKVAQMFYVDRDTYEQLENLPVGGVIYFKHNMAAPEVIYQDIKTIKEENELPMFFGIDEEGGLVTRITAESTGGTDIPSAWRLANDGGFMSVYQANRVIAIELKALGFNMNFAPVADIWTNKDNQIIGRRAFGDSAELVSSAVAEAVMAYDGQGIIPVIKHFPGHGDTLGDSHVETVHVDHTMERLETIELQPFVKGIEQGIDMIMVGHIGVPEVTGNDVPASLSKVMINDILKDTLGFEGLVISDALNMKGITDIYTNEGMVETAVESGLDIFLMPEDVMSAYNHLLTLAEGSNEIRDRIDASVLKILELKMSNALVMDEDILPPLSAVGSSEHKDIINALLK